MVRPTLGPEMTMPILEIPFGYECMAVPPKARTARRWRVVDTVPVSIREVPIGDFPIAAWFRTNTMAVRWDGKSADIHYDGTDFFKRVYRDEDEGPKSGQIGLDEFLGMLRKYGANHPLSRVQEYPNPDREPETIKSHETLTGRVLSDNRDERREKIQKAVGEFVIADGGLWKKVGEPCWRLDREFCLNAELSSERLLSEFPGRIWRATMVEDCRKHALNGTREDYRYGHIEVVLPEAFTLNPHITSLRKEILSAVELMGERTKSMSIREFSLYADLRDQIGALGDGVPNDGILAGIQVLLDEPAKRMGDLESLRRALAIYLDLEAPLSSSPGSSM
jgi:hypothetical protein